MESCYSSQSLLLLGRDIIHSCCEVEQGDPMGPLGFALTLDPIIQCIKAEISTLALNAWYLDDGTLVGSSEDLSAALHIVQLDMEDSHLETTLLRSCLSLPKFSYVLRTCPPSNSCQATSNFDAAVLGGAIITMVLDKGLFV